MAWPLANLLKRITGTTAVRRYDAAAWGRRWSGRDANFGSHNPEALAAQAPIRSRSRYYIANNPWLANGVEALVSNCVGSGIIPASRHPNATTRKRLHQAFAAWAPGADADGMLDIYSLQAVAFRAIIESGEVFVHLLPDDTAPGSPLRIRLLDGELCDASMTRELGGGARVVAGIEFAADGRRVAYHMLRRRPTDLFATYAFLAPVRIPATEMLHVFRPLAPGQVRGLPWTSSVLARLRELDQFEDAVAVGQKVAAMFAGFLTDAGGAAGSPLFDGAQAGNVLETGLEPGSLKVLPAGVDIKFATPREAKESVAFMQLQLRSVAAGIGVPEYLLTGDLSQANYSSLRAALVEFRRRLEAMQHQVVIHQFCRPIWERFVTLGILSGAIPAADDFETRAADYLACAWQPPGFDWVDPLKDVQADAIAVSQGFKSRGAVVRERGADAEAVDAEIAADVARADALGLKFPSAPLPTAATPEKEADANAN